MNEEIKINNIIEKMNFSSAEKDKKNVVSDKIKTFLKNANSDEEKEYLYEVLDSISWYTRVEIINYFEQKIEKFYTCNDLFLRYVPEKKQKKLSSSSDQVIATLVENSKIEKDDVVVISDIKCNKITCNNIYILDDFIGSGDTIINNVLELLDENNLAIKKLYIICFAITADGKINLEKAMCEKFSSLEYEIMYKILEKKYDEKISEQNVLDYVYSKCLMCKSNEYKFGYKDSKTTLAINMTSPNNNISILWSSAFDNWIKLLDRDLDLLSLESRNLRILKSNKQEIVTFYNFEIDKELLSLKEFKILILIYNCSKIDENLLDEFDICNTIEERNRLIKDLKKKLILKNGQSYLEISDKKVLNYCYQFEKKLLDINKKIKQKSNRFS